jgi:DNA-directed RNA polymerase subunit RPC12/RpoP
VIDRADLDEPDAGTSFVCSTCGASVVGAHATGLARLTWTRGLEHGLQVWTCPPCSRDHLRSIEGKLDRAWW